MFVSWDARNLRRFLYKELRRTSGRRFAEVADALEARFTGAQTDGDEGAAVLSRPCNRKAFVLLCCFWFSTRSPSGSKGSRGQASVTPNNAAPISSFRGSGTS